MIVSIVFIIGVFLASFLPERVIAKDILFFVCIALFVSILILFWQNKYIFFISLIGLFLFLGIWRYSISIPVDSPDKIWHYNGQIVTFQGVVSDEPDVRDQNQKLKIKVKTLQIDNYESLQVSGKVLVTANKYPEYNYGDGLQITCTLKTPEKFSGFSYDRYLARFDIYSVCYYPSVTAQGLPVEAEEQYESPLLKRELEGVGLIFFSTIFKFKDKLKEKIEFGLGEPEASLAKAIILGDKKGIPDGLREKFSQAGISHIVAISGMHISILSGIVMIFLLAIGVSRKNSFYFASAFLILYIILIGMPASAIRAGIMGFLVLLALNLGRYNKLTNSLALTAMILLLINPKLLRDDIGFQLSFLAVLGIGLVYPILDKLFEKYRIPSFYGARDIINITISAQVFTTPIIAMNFSQVSLISPVSNLLVIWILPLLMILIIGALILSFIFTSLGVLFFLPSSIMLKYVILVAEWLTMIPYAYIKIYYIWWAWMIIYYLFISIIIKIYNEKASKY